MTEDRFKEVFRRITAETPDAPAFSDLETHRATPAAPIRFKPWMAATGAAALVLVVVGAFGLLGGGGPDLAAPDESTIDYVKLEYSATVNPVCEGGEIIDNGGFDEATIEIWGPNADEKILLVATFPDGSTERTVVERPPGNPDTIWVTGDPEEYPASTKFRVVECEGIAGRPPILFDTFTSGGPGGFPSQFLEPPPGFETWGEAMSPQQGPVPTEWNGNSVLLYEIRNDLEAGSSAVDIYVTEDGQKVLRLHAEQAYAGVGEVIIDYSVVDADEVTAGSVSFDTTGLTAIGQSVFELGPEDCPVTAPSQGFTPPDSHPATPSDPDSVWFGKDELWTVLSTDGISEGRKSVWWSANFTDPGIESSPDITVTYTLLNSTTPLTIVNDQGTNASTPEDGLFIIAGFEPANGGCWQVTAVYKNASLSYVYYNPGDGPEISLGTVPDVVGMTVNEARSVLETLAYRAAFHDSQNPTYEVCAQEPGAGLEIDPGETIGMRTAPPGGCDELMGSSEPPNSCDQAPDFTDEPTVYFNCGDVADPDPRSVQRVFATGLPIEDAAAQVFANMLRGPTFAEREASYSSFFSEETAGALLSVTHREDTQGLVLDFTDAILVNNASTSNGSRFFLAELLANAFQFEQVGSVEFRINGSCEAFWEFLQAGPTCNVLDRAGWEQMQSQWESG